MTAETAVALPALVLVLTASLWAVAATDAQLRCVDAARAGARAAARGEAPEQVRAVVLRLAPADATVSVAAGAGTVRVEVTATVRPLWRSFLRPVRLRASAVSDTEPGVLPPPPGALSSATLGPTRSMPSTPPGSPRPAPRTSGALTRRERDAGPGEAHGGGRSSPHLDDAGTQERR
ncbi:TadE family type IV pilus minor pilin [Microbispora sp. H10670]|uniref:TadE family type IV pilus minor pilin n=1 Tax=Microbispora sp. H10670 TaxID=2729108 RepID=UPI00287384A2|nr:TadE family type IV pilus minor pilin [Microbispora sp. H10670]